MSGVGKVLVVLGGVAVTAGALWWWFTRYPTNGVIVCENFKTESECTAASCYWYDGSCHEYPPHDPDEHFACVKDPMTNLILCTLVDGAGTDQCDPFAPPDLCWDKVACDTDSNCGVGAKCWNNKCYWTANEYLDWTGEQTLSTFFEFDKRVVGNKIIGDVTFTLPPWNIGCTPRLKIFLVRDGKRVKTVYNQEHAGFGITYGDPYSRVDPIVKFMSAEAADGIEFECGCNRGFPWYSWSKVLTSVNCQYIYI